MKYSAVFFLVFTPLMVQAQDDAFLACADITDRAERVKCLEDALNAAVDRRDAVDATANAQEKAVETFGTAQNEPGKAVEETVAEPAAEEETRERSFFRLPRIGNIFRRDDNEQANEAGTPAAETSEVAVSDTVPEGKVESFGRQTRVVVNDEGKDELVDTVRELQMAKPNQWLIRLGSGQVWRQVAPKRLNLREGDEVRIYPSHWGDNYRLEATRLSGFIQVVRIE